MSSLEADIDALYQKPLAEFTAARNALAKTLKGPDAARVRKLPKPTVVPWAVNQLYWQDRAQYERLMKAGAALREAQIAALKGRRADLRHATDAHREALANAVQRAREIAAAAGSQPNPDVLSRTLDALALSPAQAERHGRLSETREPAGFEALAGVKPVATPAMAHPQRGASEHAPAAGNESAAAHPAPRLAARHDRDAAARSEKERERRQLEREDAARRRQAEAAVKAAEKTVERARAAEERARKTYEDAQEEARQAQRALATARLRLGPARRT